MTIFTRPSEWARSGTQHSAATPFAGGEQHYFAFLSYSHRDSAMASWLHDALEKYRVPMHLVGRVTDQGSVPRRLTPIFRDIGELPASSDLGHEIKSALAASRFLVVLCSPDAANSRWTNAEVEAFKRVRPDGCVFAAIIAGEPFASDIPGRESEECLPRALRYKYDRRGRQTTKRAEPLAADLREPGEVRRLGFLKLVAGMLGVGLDDLVRREAVRRHRHLAAVAGASLLGMLVASALALAALQARDEARDQRREAESLVGFMLGDLKDKLEPIGRLDVLDGVGSRVLAYYSKQDTSELSDAALLQRSRALALMAGVASSRGNLDVAERLYREAMAGTTEAIRRNPSDPQRLFDHAQNVFWTADIAMKRGDLKVVETSFRDYKRLADRMVELEPNNMRWRMEVQNADANLGVVLFQQRRFAEAARLLENSLKTIEALATADPANREYQQSLLEVVGWLADAHMSEGRLQAATAERERHVALLEERLRKSGDVQYGQRLIPAHRILGNLYGWQGRTDAAIAQMQEAAAHAEQLLGVEQHNMRWIEFAAKARLNLALLLLNAGKLPDAAEQARRGCAYVQRLVGRDATVGQRALSRDCLLTLVQVALASGAKDEALSLAVQAIEAAKAVKGTDPASDAYVLAMAHRLSGDARRALGDSEGAGVAWAQALRALPKGVGERPAETGERFLILQRVGRRREAQQLASRLAAMGYREPRFRTA